MKKLLLLAVSIVLFQQLKAADLLVPSQFATIQSAIDAASTGDVIIVDNGTYFENINFMGKAILVTSRYHITNNPADIENTIIDGSQPTDTDFGSTVTFTDDEAEDSIIKGFTITGGSGTKVFNPNDNQFFRTGGGIIINESSPTVIYNIITDNACTAETGVFGAGGGGIRMGFGVPVIENNIIKNNLGGYAGGIMIAYCQGAVLKNNLIIDNEATGSFNGGGGVFVDWEPVTLENNTIVNNFSGDKGGGLISTGTSTVVTNCIIYGNTATNGDDQIYKRFGGGNATVTFSNIEGGFNGLGNEEGLIDENPQFTANNNYYLASNSPCIDAGNPDAIYNDTEDTNNPGNALFPAMGTLRNDMGCYGGMGAESILNINSQDANIFDISFANPYKDKGITINMKYATHLSMKGYSFDGKLLFVKDSIEISSGKTIIPLQITTHTVVVFKTATGATQTIKLLKNN